MARHTTQRATDSEPVQRFDDRAAAGRALAHALRRYAGRAHLLVLALPRGGVPVAFEVARRLGAPLDVLLVRKLGVPGHEELAMGAIAEGGLRVLNADVVDALDIPPAMIEAITSVERAELDRRARAYRGSRTLVEPRDRTVILVDDGLVTGATMQAAIAAVRAQHPHRLIVAVPLASPESVAALRPLVDELVCLLTPEPFYALSLWYADFCQTSDEEVRALLRTAAEGAPSLA
ncbi:MAG: hypothetical protein RLZZ387_604 [Chloroflexota bacterium]|jgi:predicted phosphoribosyltransferase